MNKRYRSLLSRCSTWGSVILLVSVLAACASTPSPPNNPPLAALRVVMDNNYPPYVFQNDRGEVQGILIDQWKLWEERTGVKAIITALPWGEALQRMQAGEFDVIDTIFYTDERAKILDFTAAYARIDVPIFFQNNISGIADAGSLKGFRVAVKSGDANADYLLSRGITDLAYYNSYEEIIEAAARSEQAIFVIDQPPALYFLYKFGLQEQFNHSAPLYSGEFHRAVKRGNTAVLNLIEDGFARIQPSEYQAIDRRWLGTREMNTWQQWGPYLATGSVIVLLIILVLIVFSRTLQKRVRQRTLELEETAEALHENRRFLADLIEYSGALIVVKDREGRYELINRKWEDVTGLKREDVIGQTDDVLFPGPIGRQFRENDLEVIESGAALEREEILDGARGRRFFISIKFPVRGEDGGVKGICGMITEITERKQAEEALKESERLLNRSQAIAQVGHWQWDTRTNQVNWSAEMYRIFGIDRENFTGNLTEIIDAAIHPNDRERVMKSNETVLTERKSETLEYRVVWPDSTIRHVWAQPGDSIFDDAGNIILLSGVVQDITERKRAEAEITQLNQDLERRVADRTRELAAANARLTELDQLKSKFVSDVSHELRTPIANLKLYIDLLERGKPEKQAQYITVLHQQVRRVAALVDDILDLSRLERRKEQGPVYRAVALNELVDQIVLAHQPRAEADGLHLTFEPAPDLPPVRADWNQLAQVVTNLVANALSYTSAGYVRVSTCAENNRVCLRVADSGSGIVPDDLPHLFERFYRGQHVLKNDVPGTGLGLAIVKEIVDLHEGQLEVDSQPGQGTTFRVWLPVAEAV